MPQTSQRKPEAALIPRWESAPPGLREAVARAYQLDRTQLPDSDTGADTPAWLATSAEVKDITGTFLADRQVAATAPHTTDPIRCQQLWNHSARLTGLPV